jgi:hypothetical protein
MNVCQGKPKCWEGDLSRCHFARHKSRKQRLGVYKLNLLASGAMHSNGRPRPKYVLEEQMLTSFTWCAFTVTANAPGLE